MRIEERSAILDWPHSTEFGDDHAHLKFHPRRTSRQMVGASITRLESVGTVFNRTDGLGKLCPQIHLDSP